MNPSISRAAGVFGERVRAARRELNATQEEVGEHAGIDPTTIGHIERGNRTTSLHNIVRLASTLAIDPGELTAGLSVATVPPPDRPALAVDRMNELLRR